MVGNKNKGSRIGAAEAMKIVTLANSGKTVAEIMDIVGRGRTTVQRWIDRGGAEFNRERKLPDAEVVTESVADGIESHSGYNSSVFLQANNTVLPFEENNTVKSSPTQAISDAPTAIDGFGMLQQIYDEASVQLKLMRVAHEERSRTLEEMESSLHQAEDMLSLYALDIERLSKIKNLEHELTDSRKQIDKLQSEVARLMNRTTRLESGLKA